MQIHEAAADYQEHRYILDALGHPDQDVWLVSPIEENGRPYWALILHSSLCSHYGYGHLWEEAMVTKQRGGMRLFSSLEAVTSALHQIGQPVASVPTSREA